MPRRPFAALFAAALACVLAGVAGAQRRPAAAAKPVTRPGDAVVTVLAYRGPRDPVTTASGFVVTDGRVVTALRPLAGATKLEVYTTDGDLIGTATSLDAGDARLGIVALPRLAKPGATLAFARKGAALGDKVTLFLGPKGVTRATAEGKVQALEAGAEQSVVIRVGSAIAADAVGAPVLDATNGVLGIAIGALPGRDDRDVVLDAATVRRTIGKPGGRFTLPSRDGAIAPLTGPVADAAATGPTPRPEPAPVVAQPIASDTVGTLVVSLFGCTANEAKQELACPVRIANNAAATRVVVEGGDLADTTRRRRLVEAEGIEHEGQLLKTKGWRAKAAVDVRELDAVRVVVLFREVKALPERATVVLRIDGAGEAWFGPFAPAKAAAP